MGRTARLQRPLKLEDIDAESRVNGIQDMCDNRKIARRLRIGRVQTDGFRIGLTVALIGVASINTANAQSEKWPIDSKPLITLGTKVFPKCACTVCALRGNNKPTSITSRCRRNARDVLAPLDERADTCQSRAQTAPSMSTDDTRQTRVSIAECPRRCWQKNP